MEMAPAEGTQSVPPMQPKAVVVCRECRFRPCICPEKAIEKQRPVVARMLRERASGKK